MMEPIKLKAIGMFSSIKKRSEDLEIRPGGMLVQKRDLNPNSHTVQIPTIRVRIKYGSSYSEIRISPQASFGELKKMLAVHTGLHPEEQKLIHKNKERDSKAFLDVSGVKDGSKIVLVEDIVSRERRRLEMLRNAKIEKASKLISQIGVELDNLYPQVVALEKVRKLKEMDVDNLTGTLMTTLVELDALIVNGDLKSQKRMQERRAQQCVETLDKLKLKISEPSRNGRNTLVQQHENLLGRTPAPKQKQLKRTSKSPVLMQQKPTPFVVTTKWETFD